MNGEAEASHKQARLVARHVDQPVANVDLFFVSQDQMRVVEVAQADDQRVQPCGVMFRLYDARIFGRCVLGAAIVRAPRCRMSYTME